MSRLFAIAAKDPIVPTFRACALRDAPADVRDTYAWHASTYVEQPALADLRRSFVDAVLRAQTPKACLIALWLWKNCFGDRTVERLLAGGTAGDSSDLVLLVH